MSRRGSVAAGAVLLLAGFGLGCGGKAKAKAPAEPVGGKPGAKDEARIKAFQGELIHLRGALAECHTRARAIRYQTHGQLQIEVSRTADREQPTVKLLGNDTGSDALARCAVERVAGHDWSGMLRPGDVFATPIQFPELGPSFVVGASHVEPFQVSPTWSVTTLIDQENSGNDQASLTLWRISGDIVASRQAADEIWFVLSGQGRLYDRRGVKGGRELVPGSVVYVPKNTSRGYVHDSDDPLVVLVVYAPAGPEKALRTAPAEAEAAPKKRGKKEKGDGRILFKRAAGTTPMTIPGKLGEVRVIFSSKRDKLPLYIGAITLFAKAEVATHQHEESSEFLYIVEGGGEMTIAGELFTLEPGSAMQVPPRTDHAFKNTSPTATKAIQLYVPGGPEERFRKGKGK